MVSRYYYIIDSDNKQKGGNKWKKRLGTLQSGYRIAFG